MELKEARKKAGLSQVKLAKMVGISTMSYQRYEYGDRYPDVLTAIRIADALKVKDLRRLWGQPKYSRD